jgi:hypothetical protein
VNAVSLGHLEDHKGLCFCPENRIWCMVSNSDPYGENPAKFRVAVRLGMFSQTSCPGGEGFILSCLLRYTLLALPKLE